MSFNSLKSDFIKLAASQSIQNDPLNASMFLTLASSLCHKKRIMVDRFGYKDLRVHQLLMQDSRTGKGESLKVLRKASDFCDIAYTNESLFTDAGLIGYVDSTIATGNRKRELEEGDEGYLNPVIFGDLANYEIIAFPEGKQMIKIGAYTENLLEILQLAMDTPGIVKKKLLQEQAIELECHACFIATTYYTSEFEQVFLEQGIFQRMLVIVRDYEMSDRRSLNRELIMGDPEVPTAEFDAELKKFCEKIVAQVNKTPADTVLTVNQKGRQALLKRIESWSDYIENEFTGFERKTIASYTTSAQNLYLKIAGIAAVLNGKKEIGLLEIAAAHIYMKDYMDSITKEILMKVSGVDDSQVRRLINGALRKSQMKDGVVVGGPTKTEITRNVQAKLVDVSEPRVAKILETMVRDKVIAKGPITEPDGTIVHRYAEYER